MLTHVFFDLDGTLIDSEEGIIHCLREVIKEFQSDLSSQGQELVHKTLTDEQWRPFIGMPLREIFSEVLPQLDPCQREQAVTRYRELYCTTGLYEGSIYRGVEEILRELRDCGVRLFVVTSKARVIAERALQYFQLLDYFDEVYGPDFGGAFDNKAVLVESILTKHQISSKNVLMIGDHPNDIHASLINGITPVAVTYGYSDEGTLQAAGAKYICKNPRQLLSFLQKFLEESKGPNPLYLPESFYITSIATFQKGEET